MGSSPTAADRARYRGSSPGRYRSRPLSRPFVAHARIEHAVEDINNEIYGDKDHRDEKSHALDHRIVARENRLNRLIAYAGHGEDVLDDERAGQHESEGVS